MFWGLAWVWPHHPSCWPLVLRQAPSPLRNLVSSVGSVLVAQLQAFGVLHNGQISFIPVQVVRRVLTWNNLEPTQQQVRRCDTMQTMAAESSTTHDEGFYVVCVLHYAEHCVAFASHHGNTFYIDVHGSKRLPRPGVFLVYFKCIEDLVNHGINDDTKERAAYCSCGQDGCAKCAFMLHTCNLRMPVSVLDVGRTSLQDVTAHQIWAAVKEMYPLRPPKHVVTNVDDVDTLLATLHVGAIDSYWVDIMNHSAFAPQDANRTEYNCLCGCPLRVQVVPGNGWCTAHCEQSTTHKPYISTGHKWVDNRGRKNGNVQMKYTRNGHCGGMGPCLAPEGCAIALLDELQAVWPMQAVYLGRWAAWPMPLRRRPPPGRGCGRL